MVNKEQLETVLIANWTKFINVRELLDFLQKSTNSLVTQASVSRFELVEDGFIIWIEHNLTQSSKKINSTSELHLYNNGIVKYVKTI